jgi:hypothetical protein
MTGLVPSGQITRRTLLLAGAGAAATAAIPEIARASQKALKRRSHLVRDTWEQLVGKVLQVQDRWVAPVPVTLVSVTDIPNLSGQDKRFRRASFVLVLRGPADPPLGDGVHMVKVKGAGVVEVYFSSATLTSAGWEYVAVFANGRRRARPLRDPHTKGSRKQRRRSGKKARARKKDPPKAKRPERERAPEAKPAPPAEAAPEPQPAAPEPAPAETFSAAG